MRMNRTLAFVITLLVDCILLFIGAVIIAFLNVVGIIVFLIEFYFIRFIHHKVFDFLIKGNEEIIISSKSKNIVNDDSSLAPTFNNSNVLQNPTNKSGNLKESKNTNNIEPIIRYARFSKKALRHSIFSLLTLVGFVIIAFIFSNKPNDQKFGGYLYPICENGLYGYIDSVGNKIIEPQYLWCSTFHNDKAIVVVDTIFKEIEDSISYFIGETDSVQKEYKMIAKYGYIDKSGSFILEPNFLCYVDMIDDSTLTDISLCSNVFNQFRFINERALSYDTLSWKLGYIDKKGNIVIPQKYYSAKPFNNNVAIVYNKCGKPLYTNGACISKTKLRCAYINKNGEPITDFKFHTLTAFSNNRGIGTFIEINKADDEYGLESFSNHRILLDEKGNTIDTLSFLYNYYNFSKDGIAAAEPNPMYHIFNKSCGFIDKNGNFLTPLKNLSEARAAYLSKRSDIMQAYPEDVNIQDVTYFGNGLAGVTPDGEHWFVVDKYLIIHGYGDNSIYERISGFSNGLSAVKKKDKWGYINNKIQETIPIKYDSCGIAYPDLEEAFELNNDGSINKRYWINRFDSIVWESKEAEIITNSYSKKGKSEWGKWCQTKFKNSTNFEMRYVYGLIVLVILLLAIYITNRHEFKAKIFNRKCVMIPVSVCSLLLCLYCAHGILNYLLNDYTKISKKSIKNNTANIKRINSISYNYIRYENERFMSKDSIGTTPQKSHWLKEGIGVLPTGKYISTYVSTNNDRYYAGNREIVRHDRRLVPNYKTINYGYGIIDKYQDGWKWEDYSYVDYKPVYLDYNWYYAISTFDISGQLSLLCNEDSVYSDYLKSIEEQLTANYGYKFAYTKVNDKKALCYTTYDGTPLKRVIFCANGRAYIMETQSIDKLNDHSANACSKIILKNFNIEEKDNRFMSLSLIGLMLGIILLIAIILWYYNGNIVNKKAHRLCVFSILSALINIVLFCLAIHAMYIRHEISIFNAYTLTLSLSSCFIVSIPLVTYYRFQEKSDNIDYLIPSWINKCIYSKIPLEICQKTFITFVIYPLMVISLIPCGIVTLAYTIPALLVSIIILLLSKWYIWLLGNTEHAGSLDVTFKDYYSILNIPSNASQNEINIAYNSKMAFLNQLVNKKSYDKAEYQDIQEAYRILSTPHLKSIYDNEYMMIIQEGDIKGSSFTNKEIIEYIHDVRKNNISSARNDKFNKILFIFVFIITSIIFIARCSSDANGHNNIDRGFSINYHFNRSYDRDYGSRDYGSRDYGSRDYEDEEEEEYED